MTPGPQEVKPIQRLNVENIPYVGSREDNMIFPHSLFDGKHGDDFTKFGLKNEDYVALCTIIDMSTGDDELHSNEVLNLRSNIRAEAEQYLYDRDIIAESYCVLRFDKSEQNIPNERIIGSIKELLSDGVQAGVHFLSEIEGRDPNDILIFISYGERNQIIEKIKILPGITGVKILEDGLHIYNFRRKVKRWTKEK